MGQGICFRRDSDVCGDAHRLFVASGKDRTITLEPKRGIQHMTASNSEDNNSMRLAQYLARKVFEAPAGASQNSVKRIAYRGAADTTKGETDYGGSCEESLAAILYRALEDYDNVLVKFVKQTNRDGDKHEVL